MTKACEFVAATSDSGEVGMSRGRKADDGNGSGRTREGSDGAGKQ